MDDRDLTFASKIDVWLALVTALGVGATRFSGVRRIWSGRPVDVLDLFLPLLVSTLIIGVFRTTDYVVTADPLVVHAGPIRRAVPLTSVSLAGPREAQQQSRLRT